MNRAKLSVLVIVVLAVGTALGFWLGHRDEPRNDAVATNGKSILYWHDPMVPNVRFDKPGKSPFMDMQLVPVYANEQAGGAAVRVNASVTQNLGIRLGKVEKTTLRSRLNAVGTVVPDERLLKLVQARAAGYITRLHTKAPFEHVKRGQPLADIVSPEWLAAQEEYLQLLSAQSDRGRAIGDAARQRLIVLGVPEAAIRDIEAHRKTTASTTIFSPTDGVVTDLPVREGAAFMAGAALFRISDLRIVWVNAQIPESQVSMIATGASVTARAIAWPGATFAGRVLALLPDVDAQTRTMPVRIAIDNPERKLSPGMFVSLDFTAPAEAEQLTVPSEAVIVTGERSVVIVANGDGGFDVKDVTAGAETDGKTVILSGLEEGASVVLSGQFLIDSEASLRSTATRLSDSEAPSPSSEAPMPSTERHP